MEVWINFTDPVSLHTFPIQDSRPRFDTIFDNRPSTPAGALIIHDADGRPYAVVADNKDDSVLIIDISDPDQPDLVSREFDKEDGFALDTPIAVDMALIGERKYVLVGTRGTYTNGTIIDAGLQLIDVTDPLEPTAGGRVVGAQGDFALIDVIDDVSAVQIGDHHYALVASGNVGSGAGALVIVNITNPDSLSHVWSGRAGSGILPSAHVDGIYAVHIDGHPYAVAHIDSNVAILNITQPGSPTLASAFHGSSDLTVTEIDSRHYVLAGRYPDPGFTIVDITDPANPSTVTNATEGYGTNLSDTILNTITAVEIDETHYAVTTSSSYIVVTDITDPAHPSAAGSLNVETGRDPLGTLNIHDGVVKILGRHYVPATAAIDNDGDFFAMLDITDPAQITEGRGGGDPPKFDVLDCQPMSRRSR